MKLPKLDVDHWCRVAKSWGAQEILLVATHTGGFCWWQTETSDYSVKNIAWKDGKGDLVDEVAKVWMAIPFTKKCSQHSDQERSTFSTAKPNWSKTRKSC